jgi:hypothetical protein
MSRAKKAVYSFVSEVRRLISRETSPLLVIKELLEKDSPLLEELLEKDNSVTRLHVLTLFI